MNVLFRPASAHRGVRARRLVACLLAACATAAAQPPSTSPADPSKPTPPAKDNPGAPEKMVDPTGRPPASEDELRVGDDAPPITIETWLKGEPVPAFEKGKIYFIEFWASWCAPCIANMPHLTLLQSKYASDGLVVIGVTAADPNNPIEAVRTMVEEKGDLMGYTVAWDSGRTTWNAYLMAARQSTIPCAFIIDREGRIAYIGLPRFADPVLHQLVKGGFNMKEAAENYRLRRVNAPRIVESQRRLADALKAKDYKSAYSIIDRAILDDPGSELLLDKTKFQIMLTMEQNFPKAYALANALVTGKARDDALTLNEIAWMIADPRANVRARDLDLALKAVRRATELTDNSDPGILDTLAAVHFARGEADKAVETQTRAVARSVDAAQKQRFEETLKRYQGAAEINKRRQQPAESPPSPDSPQPKK